MAEKLRHVNKVGKEEKMADPLAVIEKTGSLFGMVSNKEASPGDSDFSDEEDPERNHRVTLDMLKSLQSKNSELMGPDEMQGILKKLHIIQTKDYAKHLDKQQNELKQIL
jgi:hypothetical protein